MEEEKLHPKLTDSDQLVWRSGCAGMGCLSSVLHIPSVSHLPDQEQPEFTE